MGRSQREKGKRGERAWAEFLRERGFPLARRVQQSRGEIDGPEVDDGATDHHWEVKCGARPNPYRAYAQALRDVTRRRERGLEERVPVVAVKRDREEWLVVLSAEHYLALLRDIYDSPTSVREDVSHPV